MENCYGIYRITSPTERVYIGQSKNVKSRIRSYKSCDPDQKMIYNSIKKYGYENHVFEILIEGLTKEEVDIVEIGLIKVYKVHGLNLNIAEGGNKGTISSKPVIKFSIDGSFIKEYEGAVAASEENNITSNAIWACLKDKNRFLSGGFLWLSKEDYEMGRLPITPAVYRNKIFYKFDLKGNLLSTYDSISIAASDSNVEPKMIRENLRNTRERVKEFIFSYSKEVTPIAPKIIYQINKNGQIINFFYSLEEASNALNLSKRSILAKLGRQQYDFGRMSYKYILSYNKNVSINSITSFNNK